MAVFSSGTDDDDETGSSSGTNRQQIISSRDPSLLCILFVKDFWREAGEEMLLAAAAVCVLKTLQIFFDTSIMKFFFESKSASPLGVAAELCAIPRTASFLFLCRSLFCRCDFTVECKARQILGQIFSFFFFVAEKFAF